MTKKEVKFVRYEASEGMSLAMTLKGQYGEHESVAENSAIFPEDEVVEIHEITKEEYGEKMKSMVFGCRKLWN